MPSSASARGRLPRATLAVKLFGLSGALLAVLAIVTLVAVHGIDSVSSDTQAEYTKSVEPLRNLGDARGTFNLNRALAFKHLLVRTDADRAELAKTIAANAATVDNELALVRPTLVRPAAKRDFAQLEAAIDKYNTSRDRMLALSDAGRTDAAFTLSVDKTTPIGNTVTAEFEALFASKADLGKATAASAADRASSVKRTVLVLLVLALLAGAAASFVIVRGVRRTVADVVDRLAMLRDNCTRDLRGALGGLAEGDLTRTVTPVTPLITRLPADELGDVARAVNEVRDNTVASVEAYNSSRAALSELLGEMTAAASDVSAASRQMASTSGETGRAVNEISSAMEHVVEGAERQVRAVNSTAGTIDEVARASAESASQAQETARAATDARRVAAEGGASVAEATEAMAAVRNASAQATEAIRQLGAKSAEIGGIVDAITGIAEQTNLLALNAAIEAARAGDQGRGFAVVADEVRKLAEESQTAAASISSLIGEIQDETARAVTVVEDGATRTEQGTRTVEDARAGFTAIDASVSDMVARVEAIAESVGGIAGSAEAMREEIAAVSAVAEQTSASSEQVSASTQETSASTTEIATAAASLADTAGRLEALASRFTTER
ncbi:methyl-accepting chemotaxis protein [Conexibacter woesei]|uniref:methyl-accepting chemotaxis protein n=1 Tax=Conexibacter woesei TaxID=191495 RepID=UPI000415397E|nr:methyl-accepting chemotaxis protein [Conexibacter woesei]